MLLQTKLVESKVEIEIWGDVFSLTGTVYSMSVDMNVAIEINYCSYKVFPVSWLKKE